MKFLIFKALINNDYPSMSRICETLIDKIIMAIASHRYPH